MYKITGKNTFEVAPDKNPAEGLLDGTYYHLDIEKMDGRTWHILKDHKSYYVQWVERSEDGKTFTLKVNGQLLDHVDMLAAPVVTPVGIAFGVLVGEHRPLSLEDCQRDDVL